MVKVRTERMIVLLEEIEATVETRRPEKIRRRRRETIALQRMSDMQRTLTGAAEMTHAARPRHQASKTKERLVTLVTQRDLLL